MSKQKIEKPLPDTVVNLVNRVLKNRESCVEFCKKDPEGAVEMVQMFISAAGMVEAAILMAKYTR